MLPSFIVFCFLYSVSFIVVVNMDDWFLIWFGLELNMLSFLVMIYDRTSLWNVESCLKYFFIQSLGSAILISGYYLGEGFFEIVCSLILGYKMGGGPFFFWFPSVCSGISWVSCYMLMTFQKFLPLVLMVGMMGWWLWVVIIVSLMVGVFGSYNQSHVKYLMAFSSIHQIGWLLMCMYVNKMVWVIYYIVYMVVLFIVIFKVVEYEVVNLLMVSVIKYKLWMVLVMMNLGGVPPLLGFFMKWYGLYNFMNLNFFLVILMVLLSVIMLYVYLRICYMMMMGESMEIGWICNNDLMNYSLGKGVIEISMIMGIFFGGFILLFF